MASDEVPDGWVRLNVGGRMFVTMKQTLRASPFFARLFETDGRMPDAAAGSSTHFVDRDPDRFSKILNYLRDGTLLAEKNCKLGELRREADFYGLDGLVRIIDKTKVQNESRSTTKCVVVSRKVGAYDSKRIEIAVNPRDDEHFLLRYLQQRYRCRVRAPSFQFPYGFTFELRACSACQHCARIDGVTGHKSYDYHCSNQQHGCLCTPDTAGAMLKDVVSTLESRGYIMDRSGETSITAAGRTPTSWTYLKRDC